ncbi:MAG: FAD-dependent oxidoreductase [Pseudomonadota bacterium]
MPPKFSMELREPTIFADTLKFQARTSPCEAACPAGNPIQKMHSLLKEGRIEEAFEYLRARNPFSGVTGRVCNHPCEMECNRQHYDEALSIRALERYVTDAADMTRVRGPRRREGTGKKIAIIGSGPAGMTCAYFSSLFGHEVTVFEASAFLGGMPRIGIPDYRLPKDVVDREIGQILELGVTARTNTKVGRELSFEKILDDYDACLIATGAWKEKTLDVPGAELAIQGLSFLKEVNQGRRNGIGERVVIMGGGGVAYDCAFAARRLGATEIHIVCLEAKDHMCATPEDISQGKEEGLTVHNARMLSKVMSDQARVTGVEIFEIQSCRFHEDGSATVQPASDEKETISVDAVIFAVGVEPELGFLEGKLKLTKGKTIDADPGTMGTAIEGVFAAGDAVKGPGTVAEAIGSGRDAAMAMDHYLMGRKADERTCVTIGESGVIDVKGCAPGPEPHVVRYEEMLDVDYFDKNERRRTERMPSEQSTRSFMEIDRGLGHEAASAEVDRCFRCGHCQLCGKCVEHCPGYVLSMTDEGPRVAYADECWHCGSCRINCPSSCIFYQFPISTLV